MLNTIKNVIDKTRFTISAVYETAKGLDYISLSNYMLKVNQEHDIDRILYTASLCLKGILNYELFGFAMRDAKGMSLWIDPRIHTENLETIVRDDFNHYGQDIRTNYFEHEDSTKDAEGIVFQPEKIISYPVLEGDYTAKLYIMPTRRLLQYHDKVMSIIIKTLKIAINNAVNYMKLRDEATIDGLTGVYNRRALDRYMEHDLANSHRYGNTLSVILFDIDHFKRVNDTYGHPAGDRVLVEVIALVSRTIRKSDYIARYGGEEFVVVLPDTKFSNAIEMAERLRKEVEDMTVRLEDGTAITLTSSFGIAVSKEGTRGCDLLAEADKMLYHAKKNGRNQVSPNLRLHRVDAAIVG